MKLQRNAQKFHYLRSNDGANAQFFEESPTASTSIKQQFQAITVSTELKNFQINTVSNQKIQTKTISNKKFKTIMVNKNELK